jgi:two-component system, NtrC family, nitrogen regulation sensor histidine kinase GlnL
MSVRAAEPDSHMRQIARILDHTPFAVMALSQRNTVAFANPAAEAMMGRSDSRLHDRPLTELLAPDSSVLDFITQARRQGGEVSARRIRLAGPGINAIDVDISASVDLDSSQLILTITPHRAAADDVAAEVGPFAGVARMLGHEVKNPLAGIVGAAQLLARKAREDQQSLLTLIREEGARIQRIVDRFAAFETFFAPRTRMTNIHVVLDSVMELARASFGAQVRFDLQYDPSLPEIDVDPDHLHEACLNLVKNAVEAAQTGPRQPRVTVTTRYRSGSRFSGRDQPRARGALEISVADNGPGVPEAVAARMFEPFFTTKAGGAGVGLAVVAGIMSAHGGYVLLENGQGGACLRLLFPIIRRKGAPPP